MSSGLMLQMNFELSQGGARHTAPRQGLNRSATVGQSIEISAWTFANQRFVKNASNFSLRANPRLRSSSRMSSGFPAKEKLQDELSPQSSGR